MEWARPCRAFGLGPYSDIRCTVRPLIAALLFPNASLAHGWLALFSTKPTGSGGQLVGRCHLERRVRLDRRGRFWIGL